MADLATSGVVIWGWQHIQHPDPNTMEIHLLPLLDVRAHAFDLDCACRPAEDAGAPGFIIHHAFDGREMYEHGIRKPH